MDYSQSMTTPSSRVSRVLPAAVFLAYFGYALFQAAPHLTGADCGEYVTAGRFLGNVHPPGNPVHQMLSWLAQEIPLGDAYCRSAALSALATAGAVSAVCGILLSAGAGPLSAAGASLLFGVSPPLLGNAVITEVYALLLLFGVLFASVHLRLSRDRDLFPGTHRLALLSFLAGLGMGIHYLSLFFVAPVLLSHWLRQGARVRGIFLGAALFLCGFAVMLYLPARALAAPPLNFGDPSTVGGFLDSLFWTKYSGGAAARTVSQAPSQLLWAFEAFLTSIPPVVVPLALIGAFGARMSLHGAPSIAAGAGLLLLANVALQNYDSRIRTLSDLPRFLGLAAFPLFLFAGTGVELLFRRIAGAAGRRSAVPTARAVACVLFAAIVAVSGWQSAKRFSRSGDFITRDFLRESFLSLPPNAAVFLDADTGVFGGLALHFVERLRVDLLPVDRTGSVLASVYEADEALLKRLRANETLKLAFQDEREKDFSDTYDGAVAFLNLPDWAERSGRWTPYGRIYFVRPDPKSVYSLPPQGPVRYGRNVETSGDWKTRMVLADVLYRDLLHAPLPPSAQEDRLDAIAPLVRDDPAFFIRYADILMDRDRPGKAEALLRYALLVSPGNRHARSRLGILLARMRRWTDAAALLSAPDLGGSPEVQFYLGNALVRLGDVEGAIARYERARTLGYRTAALANNLGVALLRLGNREKARAMFQEALRLDPGYAGARTNLERLASERR